MNFDSVERLNGRCIEPVAPFESRVDLQEVCRAIEYLGGSKLDDKHSFPTSQRRDEALTILRNKSGTMHFVAVEGEAHNGTGRRVSTEPFRPNSGSTRIERKVASDGREVRLRTAAASSQRCELASP